MANELLPSERAELERLEVIIERGLRTFVDVGQALTVIRDKRLYRATHSTFEDYCRERWGMRRSYAYELIDASRTVNNLSGIPDIPSSVSQVRPLAALAPQVQREVWVKAVETAPNGKVTAAHVEHVVRQFQVRVVVDEPSPEPVNEEDDLITTERVTIVAWELALGGTVTPQSVSEMTGISTNGAWRMLTKMSRVKPIVEEHGYWFRCS